MLRSLSRTLNSRLSPITLLSRASAEQSVSSSFAACVSGSRHLSADPVLEEEYRAADAAEAAAGRQAAHEQLVFELFGIRERLREQIKNREYGTGLPKRIRRADEPKLYAVPLRVLLNAMRGSGEGNGDVLLAWERQMEEENAALDATIEKYKEGLQKMVDRGAGADMTSAQRLMLGWFNPLRTAIAREQQAVLLNSQADDRPGVHAYGPYLLLLDPDQLAVLTMHVILTNLLGQNHHQSRVEAGQARLTDVAIVLGKAVQEQVGLEQFRVRVSEENAMRTGARKAWKRATKASGLAGELTSSQLNSSADTLRDKPELLPLMEEAWQDMRGQQGLPEEVREWIEDLSDLHLKDRLQSIQNRVRDRFEGQPQAARSKLKLRRSKDFAYGWARWDADKVVQVGTILVDLFLRATEGTAVSTPRDGEEDADNPKNRAFWHKTVFTERLSKTVGKTIRLKQGFIRCHDDILKELTSINQIGDLLLLHKYQPMLIPPLPWRSLDSGGHLLTRSFLCRIGNNHLLRNALIGAQNNAEGGLSQVYAALNAVGEVGWSINQPMLDVIQDAYDRSADDEQMAICDLPRHHNVAMLAANKSRRFRTARTGTQLLAEATINETQSEKRARRAANNLRRKENREMHALRSDFELKLQVAQKFKQEPAIFFPHDLDFRGRAYPMHPHLNHMGPDVCRGLLCFAEAKPLGEQGFNWLLVQLANSWGRGVDKLPFKERRQFCERNLPHILDSAIHPLDKPGSRWWLGGEAPWQVLAACMEIRDALAWQEAWGTMATYPSRLPVQIDGSCNGLQHYAALGRDEPGGTAVNLAPSERPQDVYSEVARVVEKFVERDAAQRVPEAVALQGMVDRKLVKQSVMTSVYGVTTLGARDQVAARLRERGWPNSYLLQKIALYGAKTTLEGLGEKFSKAVAIMQWLAKCAKAVAAKERCVEWTTPLGLPVIQPYREKETHIVVTALQRLKLHRDAAKMPVQKGRQKTAFPPNYIHSLDSSHMMLTALGCKREGIAFVGVHDSFWTHPGDVPVLNRVLREAFVDLHSRPLLEQLRGELIRRNPDVDPDAFPPIPSLGNLDLQQVLESDYFFN